MCPGPQLADGAASLLPLPIDRALCVRYTNSCQEDYMLFLTARMRPSFVPSTCNTPSPAPPLPAPNVPPHRGTATLALTPVPQILPPKRFCCSPGIRWQGSSTGLRRALSQPRPGDQECLTRCSGFSMHSVFTVFYFLSIGTWAPTLRSRGQARGRMPPTPSDLPRVFYAALALRSVSEERPHDC